MREVAPAITTTVPLTLRILPAVNFALQQNDVAVIRELVVTNTSGSDWQQVTVEITSEPDCTLPWKQTLESLQAGESRDLRLYPLQISSRYLAELTEKITGHLTVTVSADGAEVYRTHCPIELLAYDQWNGVGLLPEMLAAFITPNHPDIPGIIRKAADILGQWTDSPSFDEYQSRNPNRVRQQMAAIYEAIAGLGLVYSSVPASFEESGQRVRLADTIFAHRLANCLDMSLLYAACLEAVGIHPLILIVRGHAFAGAWLVDESFPDPVNDDPSLITKRTVPGISEIVVVESTCMNTGSRAVPFEEAVQLADRKITDTDTFVLFLDVKRARHGKIRPLPLRIATAGGWEIREEVQTGRGPALSPQEVAYGDQLEQAAGSEITKQQLWERKLLDLSLRNTLLNVRMTRSMIQFMTAHLGQLEDALADGKEFEILPRPADWDDGMRDAGLHRALHQADPLAELVNHELSHHRIRTYLADAELLPALTNVYRSSRVAMEENGANTLYIGLGMLRWYETPASERPRFAPILLLPVEIIRKSARKGYVIRSREEETVMNITLLEMLRQDFGISATGLKTLPRDESGIDVRKVFNKIRQTVMAMPRWDVEEQAILGTFSFSKFILWNDIHNNADKLARNPVVASLMSGKLEWQARQSATAEEIKDEHLHPAGIALPVSTDASQLQAIWASGQDQSFVLHGPPGTGKSQTITNIIANTLYAGKRVLFVAAKKAALDVVESRLESIGLGPFCLELHSNKAKKSAVLEQLKAATEIAYRSSPEGFELEANRLFELRNDLNRYVEALHRKHPSGYSLYDLFTAYSQLPKGLDHVQLPASSIAELTPERLARWQELAEEMQTIALVTGSPQEHPLRLFDTMQYAQSLRQEVATLIDRYLDLLARAERQTTEVTRLLRLDTDEAIDERAVPELVALLLALPDLPPSLLRADTLEQTLGQVTEIAAHGRERDRLKSDLLQDYHKEILAYAAVQAHSEWNIAADKWFLPRWLRQNKLLKDIRRHSRTGKTTKEQVPGLLQSVAGFQEEQARIDQASWLPGILGFLWRQGDADWDLVADACEKTIGLNRSAGRISGPAKLKAWRDRMADEWSEGSKAYLAAHRQDLEAYLLLREQLAATEAALQNLLGLDGTTLTSTDRPARAAATVLAVQWRAHLDRLRDWCTWKSTRSRLVEAGLDPLVIPYEEGVIQPQHIVQQYRKGLYRSAAEHILHETPELVSFSSDLFDERIRRFRRLKEQFEDLTRRELYARLAARIPDFTQEASQSSEIGVLQRAIRNNGRAMSIRKLFDLIPHLLPRLTPCMLMSPISVAQYFDADTSMFDLVIFDEASQLPTCEAVGAIARGKHLIVVGDPKQMPPTSFFSTNQVDEENIEKEDLESILDDCLALSMPSRYLLWHYRSKHESLIAFSNANYYDNKLLTFPSTDDITSKVTFVPVEGFYDKGRTRQNPAEAKAIAEEVARRLSDPVLSQRSIGIVTFSSVQQILVEDTLTELFAADPGLESKAYDRAEPLFVKNLENVQGDERDVILFSIGYGPDKTGKVSMNFGPINRAGGWRRLNVAVSRARYEMKVFSTLHADQVDLNRTSSDGVAGLKAFLAYAEKGKTALPLRTAGSSISRHTLEDAIAQDIRARGYEVDTHIGRSDYRIDIAVVDKRDPSRYILAVLTDGLNYRNAATSNDREIVQVNALQMLGWNIHRVWSADWWESPGKVLDGILAAIGNAEKAGITEKAPEPAPEQTLQPQLALNSLSTTVEPVIAATRRPERPGLAVPYQLCRLEPVPGASSDDFLHFSNHRKVMEQIAQVLATEAPISKDLLSRRVLSAWGASKIGTRISAHFDELFKEMKLKKVKHGEHIFFWNQDQDPKDYQVYRIAGTDTDRRDADDLPPEEVAVAVKEILRNQISLSRSDLVSETMKALGYTRTGSIRQQAAEHGIKLAVKRGFARASGDRVTYTG